MPGENIPPSRAVSRIRVRYRDFLPLLPPGEISPASLQQGYEALRAHPQVATVEAALRVLRQLVFERLYTQDVQERAPLRTVTLGMSTFAQFAIVRAQEHAYAQMQKRHGTPTQSQQPDAQTPRAHLWLIGMGKLGARELNVSSDVDLVAIYESAGQTWCDDARQESLDNHEFFCEQVRLIHRTLGEHSAHGFVFRLDWQLRPYGGDGPWAMSLESLTQYFARSGREWERFAWLKSRLVSGAQERNPPLPSKSLQLREVVRRFVFRRFLDHKVFVALRELHARIRAHVGKEEVWGDVKLGRGGIREIEFAAQVQQIVRGGAQPELLTRTTLGALQRLEAGGLMSTAAVGALSAAYDFLRRCEHRIQYLDDAQTHALPPHPADRLWLAQSMGFDGWQAFESQLRLHREAVAEIFEQWIKDERQATISVSGLVQKAPWTQVFLRKYPDAVDETRDPQLLHTRFDPQAFERTLEGRKAALLQTGLCDEEALLNVLRRAQQVEVFRTLARDTLGEMSVRDVADDLSAIAQVCLRVALLWAWEHMGQRHTATPQLAIIAYGKLGGRELGYGSDLDVVFVFDDAHEDAATYYCRVVRKLITWLSAKTAEGNLYEIDTALRPNGNSGLLVTSMQSFENYQLGRGANTAWTWEHQAMTRARCAVAVHATPELAVQMQERFESVRHSVLCANRNPEALRGEVVAMRQKLRDAYAPASEAGFDVKHSSGGLLDVEFAVQYLVLRHARDFPQLIDNAGNFELLRRAELAGLLPGTVGTQGADAYAQLRAWQHAARLRSSDDVIPLGQLQGSDVQQVRARVRALWQCCFEA